jgi:hypothetical protein
MTETTTLGFTGKVFAMVLHLLTSHAYLLACAEDIAKSDIRMARKARTKIDRGTEPARLAKVKGREEFDA